MIKINLLQTIISKTPIPFIWGDSHSDVVQVIPSWKKVFDTHRQSKYPFVTIDCVELYFENADFQNLNEIMIPITKIDSDYSSEYFDNHGLTKKTNYSDISKLLLDHRLEFKTIFKKTEDAQFIVLENNATFVFGEDDGNRLTSKLLKVYLKRK